MKKFIIIIFITLLTITICAKNDDIDTQRFKPSLNLNGMMMTDTTNTLDKYDFAVFMYMHYDKAPFVFHKKDGDVKNIVNNVFYGDLIISFGLFKDFEIGIDLPVSLYTTGDGTNSGKSLDKFSIGDLKAGIRYSFLKTEFFSMGAVLNAFFPTGGNFNTSGGFNLQPMLIADFKLGKASLLSFNIGYTFKSSDYENLETKVGDEVFYHIGNKINISPDLDLLIELFGAFQASHPFEKKEETPLELLLGLNYYIGNIKLAPAVALGLVPGVGTPLYRIILGVGYVPHKKAQKIDNDIDKDGILNAQDKCPLKPEDKDDFEDTDGCPDLDNDKDGIPDKDDKCINEAEDKDSFEDEDGCPDPDNDNDKVLDKDDKCPNKAEDIDSFEDEDGCPDVDNDEDGILDKDDKCMYDPEDKDGFEDEDGCPDPDNDQDGILDKNDKCPMKPENYNGNKDEDGCPDKGKTLVQIDLKTNKIMIFKKVYFKTGSARILKKSYSLLNVVVTTLKKNPQIKKVLVEGHTDSRGSAAYNKDLSQKRAESVMKYLIKQGVSEDRLEAKGYGEEKPIDSNSTKIGREHNRRVEFTILEQ